MKTLYYGGYNVCVSLVQKSCMHREEAAFRREVMDVIECLSLLMHSAILFL
jgi:hypothetical protein